MRIIDDRLYDKRREHLFEVFDDLLRSPMLYMSSSLDSLYERLCVTRMPQYYITVRQFIRLMYNADRGFLPKHKNKLSMYLEMRDKYESIVARYPQYTRIRCIEMTIHSGASRVFLDKRTIQNLMYESSRKRRRKARGVEIEQLYAKHDIIEKLRKKREDEEYMRFERLNKKYDAAKERGDIY